MRENNSGTRIFKIDGEMYEIIEPKVGNPQNSVGQEMRHFEPSLKPVCLIIHKKIGQAYRSVS